MSIDVRIKKILGYLDSLFKERIRISDMGMPVGNIDRRIDLLMNALRMIEGKQHG